MFFWNKICGLALIFCFFIISLSAQNSSQLKFSGNSFIAKNKIITPNSAIHFTSSQIFLNYLTNTQQIIPADFATCNYGFFCKKELILEKAIKIPLRIRLGSVEQCNYYEGYYSRKP